MIGHTFGEALVVVVKTTIPYHTPNDYRSEFITINPSNLQRSSIIYHTSTMSTDTLPHIYTAVPLSEGALDHQTTSDDKSLNLIHFLHFTAGSTVGNICSILGFQGLYGRFVGMSMPQVLLYSVVWALVTSLAGNLLWNSLSTCFIRWAPKSQKLNRLYKVQSILQYEYSTYLGIFLGFCFGCTVADVKYGMPWKCIVSTVLMALTWASLMVWCACRESERTEANKGKGTTLPFVVV